MDCTGSMQPWINEAKNTLSKVIHSIKDNKQDNLPNYSYEVGFVGFRDKEDNQRFANQTALRLASSRIRFRHANLEGVAY